MDLVTARAEDVDAVLGLREAAAAWLLAKGIQQWRPGELPRAVVEHRIAAGTTFVLFDAPDAARATVTIDFADENTWGPRGVDGTAGYVHTLVVHPDLTGAGLGRRIMSWAETFISSRGRAVCRLDCAEQNVVLHDWYRRLGYGHVGRRDYGPDWFSVALFERDLVAPVG